MPDFNRPDTNALDSFADQLRHETREAEPSFVSITDALGNPQYDRALENIEKEMQQVYRRLAAVIMDQRTVNDTILPRMSGLVGSMSKQMSDLNRQVLELRDEVTKLKEERCVMVEQEIISIGGQNNEEEKNSAEETTDNSTSISAGQ